MRIEIRYLTSFTYSEQARESHNVLRARPTTDAYQRLISYSVLTDPPARLASHTDYWGTHVDTFDIRHPHDRLQVLAESSVETSPRPELKSDADLSWYREEDTWRYHHQFLQPSRHTSGDRRIVELARIAVEGVVSAVEAFERIGQTVHDELEYKPGTTYVGIDLARVLEQGQGVCQDFAHLALSLYRGNGIPARYVSGYLYAVDQASAQEPEEAEVEVQTHAWVEALIPGFGWWPCDPTNLSPVGERHVKIGHGRDYDDVLPLRGVYHGPADHQLGVSVRMSRETLQAVHEQ